MTTEAPIEAAASPCASPVATAGGRDGVTAFVGVSGCVAIGIGVDAGVDIDVDVDAIDTAGTTEALVAVAITCATSANPDDITDITLTTGGDALTPTA